MASSSSPSSASNSSSDLAQSDSTSLISSSDDDDFESLNPKSSQSSNKSLELVMSDNDDDYSIQNESKSKPTKVKSLCHVDTPIVNKSLKPKSSSSITITKISKKAKSMRVVSDSESENVDTRSINIKRISNKKHKSN